MTTAKWLWRLTLSVLAVFAVTISAEPPKGFVREVCKYRKGKVIQPVSEFRRRLHSIREQMKIRASLQGPEIDAYILPSYDDHLNQEVAAHERRLHYLTGFTGIKAFAAITHKGAALWLEDRYVQQADGELDCEWDIYRMNDTTTIAIWLDYYLYPDQRVGADPHLVPHHLWLKWERELKDKFLELTKINNNLVDLIWGSERPSPITMQITVQERLYAGDRWEDKVSELRRQLESHKCDAMVVTSLTEIAYLLNIRGRDIPYTPVVKSYLIVSKHDIFFYVDRHKFNLGIDLHLHTDCFNDKCVQVKDYYQVWNDIRTYSQIWKRVLVPAPCVQDLGASEAVFSSMPLHIVYEHISPIIFMRAQKNSEEQRGMHQAHVKDGAAICEAMSNLEMRFFTEQWSEEKIKYEIERSRLSQTHSKGLSMRTVIAFGEHASYPYYISSNITDIEVTDQSMLVIESGGQYFEGTTDVARTFIFGEPNAEMKRAYTNVLAGILRLSQLKFPSNIKYAEVDTLVRSPVWDSMIDYPQATGHGIGAYGAVEEPPIAVAYGMDNPFHFKEGYFFSSESGYFKRGEYGVRIKNVLEVLDTKRVHPSGAKFLQFNDVTLVPYESKLIDGTLLSALEKRWLNEYNSKIRKYVGSELKRQGNMLAFYWMMNKTRHVREYLPEDEYRAATGAGARTRSFLTITVPALLLGLTVFGSFLRWLL
ncbi:xaa-Pro aminopeptidase 2-like [Teleopsis dalmanni]|uniref:xaa-Pro aminopeptidase 2-like n=1 Tax=Teleopsis dalmanni TaxID=139649 RepID=UPI0018CF94A3|nr:xaa-Pro aminopeptidase 2-like [Teleopsis dalmanni]